MACLYCYEGDYSPPVYMRQGMLRQATDLFMLPLRVLWNQHFGFIWGTLRRYKPYKLLTFVT